MLNQSTIRVAGALFVLLVGLLGSMPHLATAQAQEDRFYLPQPTQPFEGKVETRIGTLEYITGTEARVGISWWIDFYDQRRPHSSLYGRTPNEAYIGSAPGLRPASLQPQAA